MYYVQYTINCHFYSEKRPGRSDLIVLVAHNDDPTGITSTILYNLQYFNNL